MTRNRFGGKGLAIAKGLAMACVVACLALKPGGLTVGDAGVALGVAADDGAALRQR